MDVSIVIAAWNAAAFLHKSIGSALAQEGVSLEIIVCDDASTDGTADVVGAFNDPRVRYLRASSNGGPAAARNMGLTAAAGEWILVLDADDEMEPGRAKRLIDLGKKEHAQIVADNFRVRRTSAEQERLHIEETLDGGFETINLAYYAAANLMFGDTPSYGYLKPVFRTKFLREHDLQYPEFMRIGEDFALVCEVLARGGRFVRVHFADYVYNTHAGSISHRIERRQIASMIEFDRSFIARHSRTLTTEERRSFERHLGSLKTADVFSAMVDGLKGGRLGQVLLAAAGRPQALRLMAMPVRARLDRLKSRLRAGKL